MPKKTQKKAQKTKKHKHGGRVIRTDTQKHLTFTLDKFIVTDENGEISDELTEKVTNELQSMIDWMTENETAWCQGSDRYEDLAREFMSEFESLNKRYKAAQMRAFIGEPVTPALSHEYNMMEMFRLNISSTLDLSITMLRVEELFSGYSKEELENKKPSELKKAFVEKYCGGDEVASKVKVPSSSAFRRHISAWLKTGKCFHSPSPSGKVPFHATDGHYRSFTYDDKMVHLLIHFSFGVAVLHFAIPKKQCYHGDGKYTCPTMRRNKNGKLIFDFTYDIQRPKKRNADEVTGFVAVDAGIKETATSSFVSYENTYSQPFTMPKRVKILEKRVDSLYDEIGLLREKQVLCEVNGRWRKAEALEEEIVRKRYCISKLKREKSVLAAREIVCIAEVLGAGVCVEDLSWVPESHWDQAFLIEKLAEIAADRGLPVVKVNASGSSQVCSHCGGHLVVRSGRMLYCPKCGRVLNRDVSSSRVLGCRAVSVDNLSGFRYSLVSFSSRVDRLHRDNRARGASPGGTINTGVSSSTVSSPLSDLSIVSECELSGCSSE